MDKFLLALHECVTKDFVTVEATEDNLNVDCGADSIGVRILPQRRTPISQFFFFRTFSKSISKLGQLGALFESFQKILIRWADAFQMNGAGALVGNN
jgi:hypothetical protein